MDTFCNMHKSEELYQNRSKGAQSMTEQYYLVKEVNVINKNTVGKNIWINDTKAYNNSL